MSKEELTTIIIALTDQLHTISEILKSPQEGRNINQTMKYIDDLQTTILDTHRAFMVNDWETAELEICTMIAQDPCLSLREGSLW